MGAIILSRLRVEYRRARRHGGLLRRHSLLVALLIVGLGLAAEIASGQIPEDQS